MSASTQCKINVRNFLDAFFRPKPDEFRLRRVELELPGGAPSTDLLDALLHSGDGCVVLGRSGTVDQLCIICVKMMAEFMAIDQTRKIIIEGNKSLRHECRSLWHGTVYDLRPGHPAAGKSAYNPQSVIYTGRVEIRQLQTDD